MIREVELESNQPSPKKVGASVGREEDGVFGSDSAVIDMNIQIIIINKLNNNNKALTFNYRPFSLTKPQQGP